MSLSTLPLSYCTNVHPGRTLEEVERGLDEYTSPLQQNFGAPLAAGLWLAQPVVGELLASPARQVRFVEEIDRRGLTCHTLNAFPFGDFHSDRVKENVYLPDWSSPERLRYTRDCATVLAELMPEGTQGSISTLPLGYKEFGQPPDFLDRVFPQLIELARFLDEIHDATGRLVRVAIEPEPFCLLETTTETISFFEQLWQRASEKHAGEIVRRHLGVCFDVCHQAVEFEDVTESIRALEQADVRINKVHITCAIRLEDPAANHDGRAALARYVEPRYLHQTMARSRGGEIHRVVDLSESFLLEPGPAFLEAQEWRVHFHVPVDAEHLGPLGTTRAELKKALAAVAALNYAPHLEVETYTWAVLPGGQSTSLVDGLTRELRATQNLLSMVGDDSAAT
jgi:hypothetical protein